MYKRMDTRATLRCLVLIALYSGGAACVGEETTRSTQFDAVRLDFALGDSKGFIIQPTTNADDGTKPWVWYAPTFIGRHPDESHTWMAKQLLDAGFAICGVDVGESYGSPMGTKAYTAFYDRVITTYGLDRTPCLLAQSRGGLMLLNWAIENAERVQCIAGIYTVCNLESYPGLDKCCGAYGVDAETMKKNLAAYNPIERVKPLVDARIPQLYIHGDSDKAVPLSANSGELVRRCQTLGGIVKLIIVQGKGHQVCPEFFQSRELVDFLLSKGRLSP